MPRERPTACPAGNPAPRPARRAPGRAGLADGGSSAIELVLVVPALLLALALFFQLAMWGIAAHALSAAVTEAGAAARAEYEGPAVAAVVARRDIEALAGRLVIRPSVQVAVLPGGYVKVDAHAGVPSVFPGLHPTVFAASVGPLQEFRASG